MGWEKIRKILRASVLVIDIWTLGLLICFVMTVLKSFLGLAALSFVWLLLKGKSCLSSSKKETIDHHDDGYKQQKRFLASGWCTKNSVCLVLFILLFWGPFWLMVLSAMNMALDPWLLSPWWLQKMLLREPFEKCRLVSAPFWTLRLWPLLWVLLLLSRVRYRREVLRALQRVKGNDSELLVLQSMLQLRHFYTQEKHWCSNIEVL